ncbi:testis-specific serine/threonine-protein kinase 2-like [Cataglyphis hispanica]|uniref:testis-specific serine/threonine-protein kinase 2-like n=1 Tax=Cataglyphis hispanica TaxID=1086592 RepID=UPI00217FDDD3|nr:testis-specific serine/threonine-protein kinase 2-like [Cataglyphis hispanica]
MVEGEGVSFRRIGSGSDGREADIVILMMLIYHVRSGRCNIITMRSPRDRLGHGTVSHTSGTLRFRRCQDVAHLTCNILRCCRHTSAIRQAPRLGIIHRDIKLKNILMDKDGHLILTDFGVSKEFLPHERNGNARSYSFCGTIEYMTPELIQGGTTGHDFLSIGGAWAC